MDRISGSDISQCPAGDRRMFVKRELFTQVRVLEQKKKTKKGQKKM